MKNDSTTNNVMARIYRAPAIVSALISIFFLSASSAYAAGPVSVDVAAGTTTYSVTNRTINHPLNTTVSAARDITPYVSKVPNGLAQSAAGDLIVATKQGDLNARFTGKFLVQTPVLKEAAKSFLRGAGYVGTAMMAYEGLEAILNANGWYINWSTDEVMQFTPVESWHPGLVQFNDLHPIDNSRFNFPFDLNFYSDFSFSPNLTYILQSLNCEPSLNAPTRSCSVLTGSTEFSGDVNVATTMVLPILGPLLQNQVIACSVLVPNPSYASCYFPAANGDIELRSLPSGRVEVTLPLFAFPSHIELWDQTTQQMVEQSPYGVTDANAIVGYAPSDAGGELPVTPNQLENAIDLQYEPYPSDWDAFFHEPDFAPDSFILDPIPSVSGAPNVSSSVDSITGNTTTSSSGTDLIFTVTNPPSGIPEITITEVSQDKEFVNGEPVKDNTTETIRPPVSGTNQPPSTGGSTGSGSGSGSGLELPSFCTWASVVCGFIDWVKAEPVIPDDDNLDELLNEVSIPEEMFTIVAPDAACPAPLVLDLAQFGSREVSYQPLCDLASTMKFLYLSLMAFAAAVLLNRSINRV